MPNYYRDDTGNDNSSYDLISPTKKIGNSLMDGLKISQGLSHSSDRERARQLKLKLSQGSDHSDRGS